MSQPCTGPESASRRNILASICESWMKTSRSVWMCQVSLERKDLTQVSICQLGECSSNTPPTSVIGIVELFTHQYQTRKDTHDGRSWSNRSVNIFAWAPYTRHSKQMYWTHVAKHRSLTQWHHRSGRKDDRAPILDVALKECDIVIFTQWASKLIRGANVMKEDLEWWLDELLIDCPRYKPKRSGRINSKYYRCGYSKVSWSG